MVGASRGTDGRHGVEDRLRRPAGWAIGIGPDGVGAVRVVTGIVLALGFAASVSAVVPGFIELIHGSRIYLVSTSLIGLGALVAGIAALISGRALMLGLLVGATLVMWAVSTARHAMAASGREPTGDRAISALR